MMNKRQKHKKHNKHKKPQKTRKSKNKNKKQTKQVQLPKPEEEERKKRNGKGGWSPVVSGALCMGVRSAQFESCMKPSVRFMGLGAVPWIGWAQNLVVCVCCPLWWAAVLCPFGSQVECVGRLVLYVKLWCGRRSLPDRFLVYSLVKVRCSVVGTS